MAGIVKLCSDGALPALCADGDLPILCKGICKLGGFKLEAQAATQCGGDGKEVSGSVSSWLGTTKRGYWALYEFNGDSFDWQIDGQNSGTYDVDIFKKCDCGCTRRVVAPSFRPGFDPPNTFKMRLKSRNTKCDVEIVDCIDVGAIEGVEENAVGRVISVPKLDGCKNGCTGCGVDAFYPGMSGNHDVPLYRKPAGVAKGAIEVAAAGAGNQRHDVGVQLYEARAGDNGWVARGIEYFVRAQDSDDCKQGKAFDGSVQFDLSSFTSSEVLLCAAVRIGRGNYEYAIRAVDEL